MILCLILQRYKSKAIHNPHVPAIPFQITVFNTSKIQIESYSQLSQAYQKGKVDCV